MGLRVLIVDDSLTFVAAMRQFLALFPGVAVIGQANHPQGALEQVAALSPDLVLLDMDMPSMQGVAVARKLRACTQPPAVVFLSMHEAPAYANLAAESGALGFVNKSDLVDRLTPILAQLIAEYAA